MDAVFTTHPGLLAMTQARTRFRSIEEYLDYDDGTDTRYELVDGVLVEMGAESTINTVIAMYLAFAFGMLGVPYYRIGIKQQIAIPSTNFRRSMGCLKLA
jgi:Uma2 family endonuclease